MTNRKPDNTDDDYQLDIGSASIISVPFYLVAADQKTQCDNPARPSNQFKLAMFVNVDVIRYSVEIDGIRNLEHPIETIYSGNRTLD